MTKLWDQVSVINSLTCSQNKKKKTAVLTCAIITCYLDQTKMGQYFGIWSISFTPPSFLYHLTLFWKKLIFILNNILQFMVFIFL